MSGNSTVGQVGKVFEPSQVKNYQPFGQYSIAGLYDSSTQPIGDPTMAPPQETSADATQAAVTAQLHQEINFRGNQSMFTNMGGNGQTASASQHLLGGLGG